MRTAVLARVNPAMPARVWQMSAFRHGDGSLRDVASHEVCGTYELTRPLVKVIVEEWLGDDTEVTHYGWMVEGKRLPQAVYRRESPATASEGTRIALRITAIGMRSV